MTSPFAKLANHSMQIHATTFGRTDPTVTYTLPPVKNQQSKPQTLKHAIAGGERTQRRMIGNEFGGGFELAVTREISVIVDKSAAKFCGVEDVSSKGKVSVDGINYRIEAVVQTGVNGSVALQCLRTSAQEVTRAKMRKGANSGA